MSLTLEKTPIKTVAGIESNVVAINSQVPFTFKRVDVSGISVVQNSTFIEVIVPKTFFINPPIENQIFYLDFTDTYISGVYVVSEVITDAVFYRLVFNTIVYTADTTCDLNDLEGRKNYSVIVNPIDEVTGLALIPSPLRYKPKQDGSLFIDLSGLAFGYNLPNDELLFRLSWLENYTSFTGDSGTTELMIGLQAKRQIGNVGGSNMWERLPNERKTGDVTEVLQDGTENKLFIYGDFTQFNINDYVKVKTNKYNFISQITDLGGLNEWAKFDIPFMGESRAGAGSIIGKACSVGGGFLTDFDNPYVWMHYKRSIAWVLDSNLNTRTGSSQLSLKVVGKDAFGIPVYTENTTPVTSLGIHTYQLPLNVLADTFEVQLLGGVGGAIPMGEKKIFKQLHACRNSFNLEWDNRNGEQEQHVFSVNQIIGEKTDKGLLYNPPIVQDLEDVEIAIERIPLDSTQTITLSAEKVSKNFLNQLNTIKKSEVISLYLNGEGTSKVRVVVVDTFSSSYGTDEGLYDFTVKIQLPPNFEIDNA
jgi:hypothetical protein